jgi:hypothetical protein
MILVSSTKPFDSFCFLRGWFRLVRAAGSKGSGSFFSSSSQMQITLSPTKALTVIAGPPDLRTTLSSGRKSLIAPAPEIAVRRCHQGDCGAAERNSP